MDIYWRWLSDNLGKKLGSDDPGGGTYLVPISRKKTQVNLLDLLRLKLMNYLMRITNRSFLELIEWKSHQANIALSVN